MALTHEQRALLDLVQERGLSCEEVGELTGISAEEARGRVDEALAAARSPEAPERARAGDGRASAAQGRRPTSRLLAAGALGAACLLAGALALLGAFEGDDEPQVEPAATQRAEGDQEVARIELDAAEGGEAEGSVVVGVGADGVPYLDLDLTGLEPGSGGELHMLWVDTGGGRGLPLPDPIVAGADGSYRQRLELPLELAGILEVGRTLEVVGTDQGGIRRISRAVSRAGERSRQGELDPARLPRRPGESVMRGRIA